MNGQFDEETFGLIDKYIANVTLENPYGRLLSKRLPPRVGQAMRGIERNNAVDALFTRISESAVRETGSSVERARARREVEKKKHELLKGWAIATGNWHTSVSDFTDKDDGGEPAMTGVMVLCWSISRLRKGLTPILNPSSGLW